MLRWGERISDIIAEKQAKAVRVIDSNSNRLGEMVRHYLSLARIENGELQPVRTRVAVRRDVLAPILDAFDSDIAVKAMKLENRVDEGMLVHSDLNMVREVFENLVSNAVKYGRREGAISLSARELYAIDAAKSLRKSHESPTIKRLYEEFLGEPNGHKSHELLHTSYQAGEVKKILKDYGSCSKSPCRPRACSKRTPASSMRSDGLAFDTPLRLE